MSVLAAAVRNIGNARTNTATQLRCLLLCHALAAQAQRTSANKLPHPAAAPASAHATMSSIIEQKAFA
jgi:hypothetical protein